MYQPQEQTTGRIELRHALAGLQASVAGVLVMFAGLALGSMFHGRSIWVVPNLFATTFYGSAAYRNHFVRTSWAGLALTLAMYGSLGAVWGVIWRDQKVRWLSLYGILAGVAVYFLFYDFIWRHLNPLIELYAPDRQLQFGHVLWGLLLARSPVYAQRIQKAHQPLADIAVELPPPLPVVEHSTNAGLQPATAFSQGDAGSSEGSEIE